MLDRQSGVPARPCVTRVPGKDTHPDLVVRVENPVGSFRLLMESASTGVDVQHGGSRERIDIWNRSFITFAALIGVPKSTGFVSWTAMEQ
jgi:hypothetical protein